MSEPKVHTQAAIATALGAEAVQAYVATLEAEVARLQADVQALRDLLAVVNRDGGHHAQAVGTRQAVEDAIAAYHALQARERELEEDLDDCRSALGADQ